MADLDPALVEKAARSACDTLGRPPCSYPKCSCGAKNFASLAARAALLSLGIPVAALNALVRGEASVRPNLVLRTIDEWHEDIGPVLWWFFPLCEPPYVGSPLDQDWPGYHTHWTPIECPNPPAPTGVSHDPR